MATRATYKIGNTTFYCHWDGYPEGAAVRMANMVEHLTAPAGGKGFEPISDRRGGLPYAFIRGNMDAEPAHMGHRDGHGDTEYHYEVYLSEEPATKGMPRVMTFAKNWHEDSPWRLQSNVRLVEFINDKGRQFKAPVCVMMEMPAKDPRDFPIYGARYTVATLDNARQIEAEMRAKGEGFAEGNPNRATYLWQADLWAAAVDQGEAQMAARATIAA